MRWKVPKIWQGGDVWILGGGPSVIQQFDIPDGVVQNVLSRKQHVSTYSPYLSLLHDKHVIGINASFMIGDWIDMVYFGDVKFLLQYEKELKKFPNLKLSSPLKTEKYNWVKTVPFNKRKRFGISEDPRFVCWNENSGAAAISIAVSAGARRVFLLGFDMKLNVQNNQHWHRLYSSKQPRFRAHLSGFPKIAEDAKRMGVEVYNVCPDSAIEVFPKITLKEAIYLCTVVENAAKWAKGRLQYQPNILQPKSFNEKVLHKKLFDRNPLIPLTLDKRYVKKWVYEKLGSIENIVPNLWVGKEVPPFKVLKCDCIVKPTHMSGRYMIVRGGKFDEELLIKNINEWLTSRWGQDREEWGYAKIDPMVIVEPLLKENEKEVAYDWKFHMFDGKCGLIYIDANRETGIKRTCYTPEWERIDVTITGREQGGEIKQPVNFNKMLEVAEKLSKGFDFVRVDLYNVDGKVFFGEMTHYPASGSGWMEPVEFDYKLGEMWK